MEVQNFQLLKTVDFDHGRTGSVSYFLRFLCTDQAGCDFDSDPDSLVGVSRILGKVLPHIPSSNP